MNITKLTNKVFQSPTYFIAFGFGSGLMPIAPGTWGTAAAIPLYLLMANFSWPIYLLLTIAAFFLGVKVCDKVSQELGVYDYSGIVWDEVVGYLLTMFLAPLNFIWLIMGFVLFRVFDIWKPGPIRFIEKRVQGGLGVMLDDVLAAIPAWVIMQLLIYAFTYTLA